TRLSNKLSKGQTQRLGLARALLHDPPVLIMDEPAAGLDPKARAELKQLIRLLADEGKTIFLSSHILSELAEMCDSLLLINEGRLIHHGDPDSLLRRQQPTQSVHYHLRFSEAAPGLAEWVELHPGLTLSSTGMNSARLELDNSDPAHAHQLLTRLLKAGFPIYEFRREEKNLENAFIDLLAELTPTPALPSN
ncbi:MAG: AAA family ATPase, partial [Verrucomicrobiales bacterium]